MATEPAVEAGAAAGVEAIDRQPSSPASTSSREDTRDARERLKKTSIAGLQKASNSTTEQTPDLPTESGGASRGRPSKKRSFEDLAKDNTDADAANSVLPDAKRSDHKRVRSVDVNSGEHAQAYAKMEGDQNNTVHEESDLHEETGTDAQKSPGGPGVLVEAPSQEEMASAQAAQEDQRAVETAPDTTTSTGENAPTGPATSGFAKTSSASPFGQPKPAPQQEPNAQTTTSSAAFSSSGLSAFATSEKSPFGAATSSKSPFGGGGGFGGSAPAAGFGSSKGGFSGATGFGAPSSSTFAGGSSAFGAAKPFGSTSVFGAPKPFGGGSGFGSGGSSFGAGKPIGAPSKDDEDDEEENAEEEDAASTANDDAEQDPRFHEQHVDTGEEDEEVHFSSRARLYFFEGAWKERGTGVFKVNVRITETEPTVSEQPDPERQAPNGKRKARLLMRADATHRVILNSPVFKGMRFGASDGSKPTGKIMHLQSLENGKPVPLQIKIGKEEVLAELYDHLLELEAEA